MTKVTKSPLQQIIDTLPQAGRVEWIGVRPERRAPVQAIIEVEVTLENGLSGDHYGKNGGKRQVTLIQAEHLTAAASFLQRVNIDPGDTRRNIMVSGINLLAFKDRQFEIGDVVLEMTGICHPCTRFEETLGAGAYNAMRGHSGINAKVIKSGTIRVGDVVKLKKEI